MFQRFTSSNSGTLSRVASPASLANNLSVTTQSGRDISTGWSWTHSVQHTETWMWWILVTGCPWSTTGTCLLGPCSEGSQSSQKLSLTQWRKVPRPARRGRATVKLKWRKVPRPARPGNSQVKVTVRRKVNLSPATSEARPGRSVSDDWPIGLLANPVKKARLGKNHTVVWNVSPGPSLCIN